MRVPGFSRLVTSTLFARVATQMFSVIAVLFVLENFHSSALSGLVVLCGQIPGIIVSPIAGALLDRGARVRLMLIDYLVGSVSIAAIAALSIARALPAGLLLGIVSLASLTTPLSRVGGRSLFPLMVPRHLWDRSNAVDSGCFVAANVLGPTFAGLLFAAIGPRASFFAPAGLLLVGAVALVALHVPEVPVAPERASVLSDAAAALRYVWGNRVLRMLACTMTVFNFGGGALVVAIPVVVLRRLHGGSTSVGLLIADMGIFAFLAGMTTGRVGTEGRERRLLGGSCIVTSAAFVYLCFVHEVVLVGLGLAVVGLANGPLVVAMFSLRQRATEPQWFGRAFAVSMNLNFAGYPIGSAIAGVLLSTSITLAFAVAAAFAMIGGLWPLLMPASAYVPAPRAVVLD